MISALCMLLARGAVISLFVVAFVLPAMFLLFDQWIVKTSIGFQSKQNNGGNGNEISEIKRAV